MHSGQDLPNKNDKNVMKVSLSIYSHIKQIRLVGKDAIDKLLKELNSVLELIQSFQKHLLEMVEESNEADYDLREFVKELEEFINSAQELINNVSQKDSGINNILNSADRMLSKVPAILVKSQNFGLSLITDNWPTSVEELQKILSKKFNITNNLKEIYPDFVKGFEEVKEFLMGKNKETLEEFANLSSLKQNATLVTLEKLNSFCCKLIVFLDKKEIQFSFKEGVLLDKIKSGKLKAYCILLKEAYEARIHIAGYQQMQETYPYSRAKLVNREKYLEDIKKIAVQGSDKKYFKNSFAEIKKLIETGKIIFKGKELTKEVFQTMIVQQGLVESIRLLFIHCKDSNKSNISLLKDIEDKFKLEIKYKESRIEKLNKEIKRLEGKVNDLRQGIEACDPSTQYISSKEMLRHDDVLTNAAMGLVESAYQNMRNFLLFQVPTVGNSSVITNYMETIENKIRQVLDEEIFECYFQETNNNANSVNQTDNHSPIWLESAGASFQSLKKVALQLDVLKKEYFTRVQSRDKAPHENFTQSIEMANEFLKLTSDLTRHASQLLNSPYATECLSELGRMVTATRAGFSAKLETVQQLNNEWREQNAAFMNIDIIPRLAGYLRSLYGMMLKEFPQDSETQSTVRSAMDRLQHILSKANNKFKKEEVSNKDIVSFVAANFHELIGLLKNMPQIIASLRNISQNKGWKIIQELNLVVMDIFLFADEVEIQYFLKEGYFSEIKLGEWSLSRLMGEFHEAVFALGYEFRLSERFPYTEAIVARRNKLQEKRKDKIFSLEKGIENIKILNKPWLDEQQAILIVNKEELIKKENEINEKIEELTEKILKIHSKYLESCKNEVDGLFNFEVDQIKEESEPFKEEISNLRKKISALNRQYDLDVKTFEKSVKKLTDKLERDYMETMFSIRFIENRDRHSKKDFLVNDDNSNQKKTLLPKKTILTHIEIKLEDLRRQRQNTFYFFAKQRRTTLENNIIGLSKFKHYYKKPGYDISTALADVHGMYAAPYASIERTQMQFFRQLRVMDKQIEKSDRGKILIDFIGNPQVSASLPAQCREHLSRKIDSRVDELARESKKIWNITRTKKIKIKLLNELKTELGFISLNQISDIGRTDISLDAALDKIRGDHPDNFYLLFEGRTGKILKDMQLSTLSCDDIQDRVQAEITRLEMEGNKFILFRERKLSQRIKALNALKENNLDIGSLSDAHRNILSSYEMRLFSDIQEWKKMVSSIAPPAAKVASQ